VKPPESTSPQTSQLGFSRLVWLSILVAALGYFVDIYDLLLFSIVRVNSLKSLGLQGESVMSTGLMLLNMQMFGLLLGGIFWGILGDKRGRLSVLFGSIFIYSIANILNGFVQNVEQYALLRLIAGIGLAGELGAGITLVSELMPRHSRGYGTTIVASVGILGAVVGAFVANLFDWRTAYFVGGGLGLSLLLLRIGLFESGMFAKLKESPAQRGNFFMLFNSWPRTLKYFNCILIGLPIWYVIGILITLAPEFGAALGMSELPTAGNAVKYSYIGLSLGDLASGLLSQRMRSRRKVVLLFLGLTGLSIGAYFLFGSKSLSHFYFICGCLGFSVGFWAVFVTMAAENFGTNIRATVTTTAPNFIRGSVVPLTLAFGASKGTLGMTGSALLLGALTLLIAGFSLSRLEETYGRDLDFLEQ
jgi:MFS transporter, putative metabolite:H+ symporter